MVISIFKYKTSKKREAGFTLIEIIITLGIVLMLSGVTTFNLLHTQTAATVDSTVDTLVSDMNNQQLKAMVGVKSTHPGSYGIYFMQDRYVLFWGSTYDVTSLANFSVPLDQGIMFTGTTFPNNALIFTKLSGEMSGYTPSNNSVTLKSTSGNSQKTITLNRYGVVIGIR